MSDKNRKEMIYKYGIIEHIKKNFSASDAIISDVCRVIEEYDNAEIRVCKYCGRQYSIDYGSNRDGWCDSKCCNKGIWTRRLEKEKSNPILWEYKKTYNRILGRIKRNNLSEDCSHFEELKMLKKQYLERYNSASENDKEQIVNEFVKAMESLYDNK